MRQKENKMLNFIFDFLNYLTCEIDEFYLKISIILNISTILTYLFKFLRIKKEIYISLIIIQLKK